MGWRKESKDRSLQDLARTFGLPSLENKADVGLVKNYQSIADGFDIEIDSISRKELNFIKKQADDNGNKMAEKKPKNLIIFLRDQVKPEDLWFPREWADENMPTRRWLKDNGLSFTNSFTNTSMCSVARSTFFTSKFPAQHQADLLLSDIENPILDSEVQLDPQLPNLASTLNKKGYEVSFFGKWHLSKTITLDNGEVLYQNPTDYGFENWQGKDAGQDMKPGNAGLGPDDNDVRFSNQAKSWLQDRLKSDNKKPFAMVVSLVNPHDVLAYPDNMEAFDYDSGQWTKGEIDELPPTFNENKRANYKPRVQSQWTLLQRAAGQYFQKDQALDYLNFYGNLLKVADKQMGNVLRPLRKKGRQGILDNTMIVSTSDHGEMGMSHGGMNQKMFTAYEEAIKVPLIWSNPQYFKGGQESDALVSAVDFLPTVLGYLGFSDKFIKQQDLRGVDYSSILQSAKKGSTSDLDNMDVQNEILYTYDDIYAGQNPLMSMGGDWDHGLLSANNRIQAVRTKDYKYVRYYSKDKDYKPKNWDGELYDLRPDGGDYYPNRDPFTGELNPFKAGPLEMVNLDPKAEARRALQQKRGKGDGPVATPQQKEAYGYMAELLNEQIDNRLQPMIQSKSQVPTFFKYNGGMFCPSNSDGDTADCVDSASSDQSSDYDYGDPIVQLIPEASGTQALEIGFMTRASQTYNLAYTSEGGTTVPLASNVVGTNGPSYHYVSGIPSGVEMSDLLIEWIGGDISLSEMT